MTVGNQRHTPCLLVLLLALQFLISVPLSLHRPGVKPGVKRSRKRPVPSHPFLKAPSCPALQFGLVHISVGDLLRAEVEADTPAGQKAQQFMDAGNLVPNEVVVEMVTNRLSEADVREHGWLLDGYPRSGAQADAIEQQGIRPDVFILITVS